MESESKLHKVAQFVDIIGKSVTTKPFEIP